MANTKSFEAIYRLANFLDQESQREDIPHMMGYLALANYLKHSGYKNSDGEIYDDSHPKAAAVLVDRCWDYVEREHGREEAEKVFRAFCDKDGSNRRRNY